LLACVLLHFDFDLLATYGTLKRILLDNEVENAGKPDAEASHVSWAIKTQWIPELSCRLGLGENLIFHCQVVERWNGFFL